MKIDVDENYNMLISEDCEFTVLTEEGNKLHVCLRDNTFELGVRPNTKEQKVKWFRVDMEENNINSMDINKL